MSRTQLNAARVGRILTGDERLQRMADEAARTIPGEFRRSAFAISDQHLLTAWHCVRDLLATNEPLWFRLRDEESHDRRYFYVPLRVTNYDVQLDVAALAVDTTRLGDAGLTSQEAAAILAAAAVPLSSDVNVHERIQVIGFPENASAADSDTNSGKVVETALPLGDVSGLKLYCEALAAVDPVRPGGLSGGPVLQVASSPAGRSHVAIGVVRAAPIGSVPGLSAGGALVASRIQDMAYRLPEVAVVLPVEPVTMQVSRPQSSGSSLLTLLVSCGKVMRETVVEFEDPLLGPLTGWSHFFHESQHGTRPTAIGTAYGLKLVLSIDEKESSLDRSALAHTLWKLRKADGGWAARTQGGVGRPEVTALVVGALSSVGFDQDSLAEAVTAFEDSLSVEKDPVGMTSTYVVSAAMRGLVRAKPTSPKLPELRATLLAGAIQDAGHDNLLCWSGQFYPERGQALRPSVAHTAQAVVALARAATVLGEDGPSRSALRQATQWLVSHPTLENDVEHIRRQVSDEHWELLAIRHFTSAWQARAILASGPSNLPEASSVLRGAVQRVWQAQVEGIWEWEDLGRPIWMTYQGICLLRDLALRDCVSPLRTDSDDV